MVQGLGFRVHTEADLDAVADSDGSRDNAAERVEAHAVRLVVQLHHLLEGVRPFS